MYWFIVAIVTFYNTDEIVVHQMAKPFATKQECQEFYLTTPGVRDDVLKIEPRQRGHTLVCMQQFEIDKLDGSVTST